MRDVIFTIGTRKRLEITWPIELFLEPPPARDSKNRSMC